MSEEAKKLETPQEIEEALQTIKSIEMMGFFMEETTAKLKFAKGIFHCMDILRDMHDQLVARLPPAVIQQEQAKARAQGKEAPVKLETIPPQGNA